MLSSQTSALPTNQAIHFTFFLQAKCLLNCQWKMQVRIERVLLSYASASVWPKILLSGWELFLTILLLTLCASLSTQNFNFITLLWERSIYKYFGSFNMPSGILTPGLIFSPPFGELVFIFKHIWYSYRSSFPELSVLGEIAGVLVKWQSPGRLLIKVYALGRDWLKFSCLNRRPPQTETMGEQFWFLHWVGKFRKFKWKKL